MIRDLQPAECVALLGRNWIGRIAYSYQDRVSIEPIHYVFDDPWIFGRTSAGSKLLTLAHNRWCAFEVDEINGLFDWVSIVVKGQFSTSQPPFFAGWDEQRAITALRKLVPAAFTDADPTPHRDIVFGIHAAEITGRSSVSWHTGAEVAVAV
jgi:nitroimidazol reductase NimA-like FMN-containing flavoprotein (pyridoxamine 5'-phosphate oxidase superfamily)